MKQYKGYCIDHIHFNSEAEIDDFIKQQEVNLFIRYNKSFASNPTMGASIVCSDQADRLHNIFGFSYEELEEIENAVFAA
nr:MAG TPA: hypothetical protein [Caudoviricetes sp.]